MTTIRLITPEETYPLRHAVLWPDKPFEYVRIDNDADGLHYGAFEDDALIGVISLFVDMAASTVARFRKFAVRPDWQHRGVGTQLLNGVITEARRRGVHVLWCDARLDAADFYRRFGMQPVGDQFFKGPVPYAKFSLTL